MMFRHLHKVETKLSKLSIILKSGCKSVAKDQMKDFGDQVNPRSLQETTNNPPLENKKPHPEINIRFERNESSYILSHVHKRLVGLENKINYNTSSRVISFIKEVRKLKYNDKTFEDAMKPFNINLHTMKQQDLTALLQATRYEKSRKFTIIREMVDSHLSKMLVRARPTDDLDDWFNIGDLLIECRENSNFTNVLINYLTDSKICLTDDQFLHLLFLLNIRRHRNDFLAEISSEDRISQIVETASIEDLAIVCLAFFKTKTGITNIDLLTKVVKRTIDLLPTIDFKQPGYCSIIKAVRYSRLFPIRDIVGDLVNSLVKLNNIELIFENSFNAIHTIKLMEAYRIYNSKIFDLIYNSIIHKLDKLRIKDVQYFLTSLSNFAHPVDRSIIRQLGRLCTDIVKQKRFDSFRQDYHLMPLLRSFLILNYYNYHLIEYTNKQMRCPDNVEKMRQVLEFDRTALLVYVAHRIERRKVKLFGDNDELIMSISSNIDRDRGNMGSVKQDLSVRHLDFILNQNEQEHFIISKMIRNLGTELVSTEELKDPVYNFVFQTTMPHQNYNDLVVSKNCNAPGDFDPQTLMPKRVPQGEKHCLLVGSRNFDYFGEDKRLSGYKSLNIHLLSQLGYTVINVDLDAADISNIAERIKSALS